MKIKIKVTTPKGQAEGTQQKIKWFFKLNRGKVETYVNKENDTLYIEVEGQIRDCLNAQKRVNMFNQLPQLVIENKVFKKSMKGLGATEEQFKELQTMFKEGTTIEILKEATAKEIVEENKTLWTKIKETFKKI